MKPLTVGQLRKLIKGLPDKTPVLPDWAAHRIPDNDQPGVEILGASVCKPHASDKVAKGKKYLSIHVGLFDLGEEEDEEDEEDGIDEDDSDVDDSDLHSDYGQRD